MFESSITLSINTVLLMMVIVFIGVGILVKYLYERRSKEAQIREHYSQLSQQSLDNSEKLYSINNQLYEEIAQHETTEELLVETRNYLQSIINSMPSILIGINREGIVTHWNTAAFQKTQIPYHKALGKHFKEVINEPNIHLKLIASAIDKKAPKRLEAIQEGQGSHARYKDITIFPLTTTEGESAVIQIDDVTTRIHLENMIIQNEKMGSLGELAAGVAHEINNPLGTILQSIQNIQRRLSDTLPANSQTANELGLDLPLMRRYLEERKIFTFLESIKEAGERAADIVTNMLEFSRTHTFKHDAIDLGKLLKRTIDLALSSSSLSKQHENINFSITHDFPPKSPMVSASSAELQQVVLNIINNAYQAYSEAYIESVLQDHNTQEGELIIEVCLTFEADNAIITITDNGPGMDDWTQRHIFDPFFTTKDVNKGTGLGLSVSYFIITEHHNGSISVNSALGQGTTFTIKLPIDIDPKK